MLLSRIFLWVLVKLFGLHRPLFRKFDRPQSISVLRLTEMDGFDNHCPATPIWQFLSETLTQLSYIHLQQITACISNHIYCKKETVFILLGGLLVVEFLLLWLLFATDHHPNISKKSKTHFEIEKYCLLTSKASVCLDS